MDASRRWSRRLRIVWRLGAAAAGVGLGLQLGHWLVPHRRLAAPDDRRTPLARLADPPGRPLSVLLLGVDGERREDRRAGHPTGGETQVLLLARVSPQGGLDLLQLPVELTVSLPGQRTPVRLADLRRLGGVALTADVIGQLLGGEGTPLTPDRYLVLPRRALRDLVDGLGGVPLELENSLQYRDRAGGLTIDLQAGRQSLDGKQVEQLLRFRGPDKGEGGRRLRQQLLVQPLAQRLGEAGLVSRLPPLLDRLQRQVDTNLSAAEMLSLVAAGLGEPQRLRIDRLPLEAGPGSRPLDSQRAEALLEHWRRPQGSGERRPGLVAVDGTDAEAVDAAVQRLEVAGLQTVILPPAETAPAATVILHGSDSRLAAAVRQALGQGGLQAGPGSAEAEVVVHLGQTWRPPVSRRP
jgi:LCP family protein required for cell wall assembly